MLKNSLKILVVGVCVLAIPAALASTAELYTVAFPEKIPVDLSFMATPIAPAASLTAQVMYKRGQARIDMYFTGMKPAILFGGDVTCYVVWAATRDGQAENLGELLTRRSSGLRAVS